jgi:hypothetical protein
MLVLIFRKVFLHENVRDKVLGRENIESTCYLPLVNYYRKAKYFDLNPLE